MAELSTYLSNHLQDHAIGRTAYTMPAVYYALIKVRDQSVNLRSIAVALGDFTIPATPNGHLYRCTTAGTTGAGEPAYPTTSGGTVTDGTAVWTEHTPSLQSATNIPECAYTGYARVANGTGAPSLMGASASGSSTNASAVTFPQNTGGTTENVVGWATYDALTVGNLLEFGLFTSAPFMKAIATNDTPSFAASALTRSAS